MPEVIGARLELDGSQAMTSMKAFKSEIKAAQSELLAMSEKFGETSVEAQNAAKKVAELKDKLGDANKLVDSFNPDQKFRALSQSLSGVLGGFTALTGAMGLLGVESQDVQKQLLKVQSAMALSQGLNQVGEAISSFKNLGATIVNYVVKAFSTLKGAIIATGIGALGVALAYVVTNWKEFKEAILNLIPGLGKVASWVGSLIDGITDFIGVTSDATRELKKMQDAANDSLALNKKFLEEHGSQLDEYTKKKIAAKDDYNKLVAEGGHDIVAIGKELNRKLAAIDQERTDANNEAIKNRGEDAARLSEQAAEKRRIAAEKERGAEEKAKERRFEVRRIEGPKATVSPEIIKDINEKSQLDKIAKKFNEDIIQGARNRFYTVSKLAWEAKRDEEILAAQKVKLANDTANALGALADVFGRQTAAGKTLAIAQALINTYQGISRGVAMGMPWGIPSIVAASAVGFKAVRDIIATKVPGSNVQTNIPSQTSITAPIQPRPSVVNTRIDSEQFNQIGNATVKAFVVESDITASQERSRRLNRAARI